jgi:hypothetical protein
MIPASAVARPHRRRDRVEADFPFDALDYWNQTYNRRAVENELKKLDAKGKRELAEQLLAEAEGQAAKEPAKAAT